MYGFITHTFNVIKGVCSHGCTYCYMKKRKLNPIRFDETELKTDLGSGNFIFVGSGTDMFAADVPADWIANTLKHCRKFDDNKYLFQSKDPGQFLRWHPALGGFFNKVVLGTTLESNRRYGVSHAPDVYRRADALGRLSCAGFKTMVTIEPVMDFDTDRLVELINLARPAWVNIGADSGGNDLPEPSAEKIAELIAALKKTTDVKIKTNLKRITGKDLK